MMAVFSVLLRSLGLGPLAMGSHCREFSRMRLDLLISYDPLVAGWQIDWTGEDKRGRGIHLRGQHCTGLQSVNQMDKG